MKFRKFENLVRHELDRIDPNAKFEVRVAKENNQPAVYTLFYHPTKSISIDFMPGDVYGRAFTAKSSHARLVITKLREAIDSYISREVKCNADEIKIVQP